MGKSLEGGYGSKTRRGEGEPFCLERFPPGTGGRDAHSTKKQILRFAQNDNQVYLVFDVRAALTASVAADIMAKSVSTTVTIDERRVWRNRFDKGDLK